MQGRFTLVTIGLAAAGAFLIGLAAAGRSTPPPPLSARAAAAQAADPGEPAFRATGPASSLRASLTRPVDFADVVERINLAVVNIDATAAAPESSRRDADPGSERYDRSPRDRRLFGDTPGFDPPEQSPRPWAGSGFVIDPDGHILTNNHVVERADRITVKFADGSTRRAHVVGRDPDTDIALIKVDGAGRLPYAPLGDSDTLRVGEWVCAIGNPLAYEHTVTVGVVSYIGRKLYDRSLDDYIQTDAAINFGNSGGPLINASGEVVGISAAISQRASSIGFAIPINQARRILPQLREQGRVSRGFIGVGLTDVTPDLQRSLDLETSFGALVQDVTPGSPGERAGLRPYDLIVSVDGRQVLTNAALIQEIAARRPGTTARLDVLRDRRPLELQVRLTERPQRAPGTAGPGTPEPETRLPNPLGLMVRRMNGPLPRAAAGVLVTAVTSIGPAAEAGVMRGHILMEINRQSVGTVADFERITRGLSPGDVVLLYVYAPDADQRTLLTARLEGN